MTLLLRKNLFRIDQRSHGENCSLRVQIAINRVENITLIISIIFKFKSTIYFSRWRKSSSNHSRNCFGRPVVTFFPARAGHLRVAHIIAIVLFPNNQYRSTAARAYLSRLTKLNRQRRTIGKANTAAWQGGGRGCGTEWSAARGVGVGIGVRPAPRAARPRGKRLIHYGD